MLRSTEQRAVNEELFVFHFHMTLCDLYDRLKLKFGDLPAGEKVNQRNWTHDPLDSARGVQERYREEREIRSVRVGRYMEIFNETGEYQIPSRQIQQNDNAKKQQNVRKITDKLKERLDSDSKEQEGSPKAAADSKQAYG